MMARMGRTAEDMWARPVAWRDGSGTWAFFSLTLILELTGACLQGIGHCHPGGGKATPIVARMAGPAQKVVQLSMQARFSWPGW